MKKNFLNKILLAGATLMVPMMVSAKSANISIVGNENMYQDEYVTVSVEVNNIVDEDNISAVGGDVVYDSDYLTLVSTKGVKSPYNFDGNQIRNNTYRIAGVDFTLENGINNTTKVYELTFKANKLGTTTIEFKNPEVVASDVRLVETTTSSKTINILKKETILENTDIVKSINKNVNIIDFVKNKNIFNKKINPFNINKILKNLDINKIKNYYNNINR